MALLGCIIVGTTRWSQDEKIVVPWRDQIFKKLVTIPFNRKETKYIWSAGGIKIQPAYRKGKVSFFYRIMGWG